MTSKLIKEKNLLVVGGTGFIGRWVVYGGIKRGYRVSVLSRSLPEPKNIISGVEYLQANISSDVDVLKAVGSKHISHVVNLSGDISHVEYRNGGIDIIDSHLTGVLNLAHSLDWNFLKCFVQIGVVTSMVVRQLRNMKICLVHQYPVIHFQSLQQRNF